MKNNSGIWIIGIILLFIVIVAFIPGLIKSRKELNELKKESELLKEGNYISDYECVKNFAEYLKSKDLENIKKLLSSNCLFYNTGICNSIELCFENLEEYETYRIEKRSNDISNEETYRIYWNGWNVDEAKQIITLILKKQITTEEVTYKIKRITLSEN